MVSNNNNFNNSIAPNVVEDDLTYKNYMALLRTITGVKDSKGNWQEISINKALIAYKLIERYEPEDRSSRHNYINLEILDTETDEVYKFKTVRQAADFLDVKTTYITTYIKRGVLCKRRYKITGEINKAKFKKVEFRNIETDEILVFNSVNEAAIKMNINFRTVYNAMQRGNLTKKVWKVRSIEE